MRASAPLPVLLSALLSALLAAACGGNEGSPQDARPGPDPQAVLRDLGEVVIVPGYQELHERSQALVSAARTLCMAPAAGALDAAQDAWRAVRGPWKRSEAFGFGPVEDLRIDTAVDFGPARPSSIEAELAKTDPVPENYAASLGDTLKGLPVLEYILFDPDEGDAAVLTRLQDGEGQPTRTCQYVVALAVDVELRARTLLEAWDPASGNFAGELATAGIGSTVYDERAKAVGAIVNAFVQLDAVRRPALRVGWAPRWCLLTVRAQVGLVYFFAGIAKLRGDWLWHARPLSIWLASHGDMPVIGSLLAEPWVAYAASWFGAIFDLTIVGWLLATRTRAIAFATVVVFHVATAALFHLGMFPWIMIGNALIFFPAAWPRRWLAGLPPPEAGPPDDWTRTRRPRRQALGLGLLGLHFQVLMPLRHHLYPGDVCWTEEGFRYAWHVMLVEKAGRVLYHVTDPATGRDWLVYPREYLTPLQEKQMSFQPDMILALAHHIARDFAGRGHPGVEVRAEAYVSLNGRPSQLLLDPTVDLAAVADDLLPQPWIVRGAPRAHQARTP